MTEKDLTRLYELFRSCNGVTTDSRHCPEGSMFIALKGDKFNGNAYAAAALQSGCRCAVVDEAEFCDSSDNRYFLVDDGLETLQRLANYHRQQMGTKLIGITGTNGKTTTKELTAAVLGRKYNILYTQGNLNNSIGVPLTLLRLKAEHQLGIIEMGASHPGDIKELVDIAEPDCGLITNVGRAHLQGFGSFDGVVRTKTELYDHLHGKEDTLAFLNADDEILSAHAYGLRTVTYGTSADCYVQGSLEENGVFMSFSWKHGEGDTWHHVQTKLIGSYNFANALAAATIGTYFGVDADDVCKAIEDYTPTNSRSELVHTDSNTLIVDAYNANPSSMQASIDNFRRLPMDGKMLILGDMRELGADSEAEHQKVVDSLVSAGFKDVVLVGECFARTHNNFVCVPDVGTLIDMLRKEKPAGKTILIKGSNGTRLYTLPQYL